MSVDSNMQKNALKEQKAKRSAEKMQLVFPKKIKKCILSAVSPAFPLQKFLYARVNGPLSSRFGHIFGEKRLCFPLHAFFRE